MVKKPFKGNYLTLEDVRVSYDHKNDNIHLTAKDSDLPKGFHLTLNAGRDVELQLRNILAENGLIRTEKTNTSIPTHVDAVEANRETPWDIFDMGVSDEGTMYLDFSENPIVNVIGNVGKSNFMVNLFNHCTKNEEWQTQVICLNNTALKKALKDTGIKDNVTDKSVRLTHTGSLGYAAKMLVSLCQQIDMRLNTMDNEESESYQECGMDPVMVIIDDLSELICMEPDYVIDPEYNNIHHSTAVKALGHINLLGPSAGVRLVSFRSKNNALNVTGQAESYSGIYTKISGLVNHNTIYMGLPADLKNQVNSNPLYRELKNTKGRACSHLVKGEPKLFQTYAN